MTYGVHVPDPDHYYRHFGEGCLQSFFEVPATDQFMCDQKLLTAFGLRKARTSRGVAGKGAFE